MKLRIACPALLVLAACEPVDPALPAADMAVESTTSSVGGQAITAPREAGQEAAEERGAKLAEEALARDADATGASSNATFVPLE